MFVIFFCKRETAYEMRISDWSSDVCSSDLPLVLAVPILVMLLCGLVLSASFTGFIGAIGALAIFFVVGGIRPSPKIIALMAAVVAVLYMSGYQLPTVFQDRVANALETGNLDDAGTFTDRATLISDAWALSEHTIFAGLGRSEEHTSELQSLMRIPHAVFCL